MRQEQEYSIDKKSNDLAQFIDYTSHLSNYFERKNELVEFVLP